jgi:glycosyltransferase involved in cell wall biosynthesis
MMQPLRKLPNRVLFRALRALLLAYGRGGRPAQERKVYILIAGVYGLGGTVRAALNLAGHLAESRPVEIISVYRSRSEPFFGAFPPGVEVTALDDRRPEAASRGLRGRVAGILRARRSVLLHPRDHRAEQFNLYGDVQLVRKLRKLNGWLIGTRPALNLLAAELSPPGLVTIGQEQMHLLNHPRSVREAIQRLYPRLDSMVVLTERDARNYRELVGPALSLVRIPNTVRPLPGGRADLSQKTVLAAGRFARQKGYDLLLPAWTRVAEEHPDWRLRLCGSGAMKKQLKAQIRELELEDVVSFEGPADMAEAMSNASIFALSSRFEGFPLILLEAMSKGMAVVSFDCPTGPAEIIDDGRNGILVPAYDINAFAGALRTMIEDEELRRRCAAAAITTAEAYTMEAVGPRWETLLDELWRERLGTPAGPQGPGDQPRPERDDDAPASALEPALG